MSEQNETVFADGFSFRKPHEKAPDFIKGELSVKVDEAIDFLKKHEDKGWVNIDLKKSKGGKLYLALNTFKPEKKRDEVGDDGIPF